MKKFLISLLSIGLISCSIPISNNINQYSDLDKEYSQFKTKALTQSYLKKKMDKWLSDSKYSKNLVREIEYAKFKHKDLLKDIVVLQPTMFNNITSNTAVSQKRNESSFENYIQYINPFPDGITATDATNITSTGFTANWNAVSNATSYKLYLDGSSSPITLGNVTTYDFTGLVDGSSHTYCVKAVNSAGESSNSNTITVNLSLSISIPVAPLATDATNITETSFTAHWNAVTGATSYKLFLDGVETYTGTNTNYSVTNLPIDTSHNYYVKAVNSAGESSNSNTINLDLIKTYILFAAKQSSNSDIYRIDTDGSNLTQLTNTSSYNEYSPIMSQNKTKVTYYREATSNVGVYSICLMNTDGSNPSFFLQGTSTGYAGPSFTPNADWIVYQYNGGGNGWDIYKTNISKTSTVQLTNSTLSQGNPSVSKDGTKIVYTSDEYSSGNNDLKIMNIDGSNKVRLTSTSESERNPNFSPDGTKIIYNYGTSNLMYSINIDGSNKTLLSSGFTSVYGATFSPDSKKIVFWGNNGTKQGIFIANSDGSSPVLINEINMSFYGKINWY